MIKNMPLSPIDIDSLSPIDIDSSTLISLSFGILFIWCSSLGLEFDLSFSLLRCIGKGQSISSVVENAAECIVSPGPDLCAS